MSGRTTALTALLLAACAPQGPDTGGPIAEAGFGITGQPGQTFHFDGSESEGDALQYTWSFVQLPADSQLEDVDIIGGDTVRPTVVPDTFGLFLLELQVCDALGQCAFDDTTAMAVDPEAISGAAPVADAGVGQSVGFGNTAHVNAGNTVDPEGDALTFIWNFKTQPSGSALTTSDFSGRFRSVATFVPDVEGEYKLRLYVGDTTGFDQDQVRVIVGSGFNTSPVSDVGDDQAVSTGDLVSLDGTASYDPDNDSFTNRWAFVDLPAASTLVATDIGTRFRSTASFTPDVAGTYRLRLAVDDGPNVDRDYIDIVATDATNIAPVAVAGPDQTGSVGASVSLDGTGSGDADGDPLTYIWSFNSAPSGSSLVNSDISGRFSDSGSFTPDVAGTYTMRLYVSDGTDFSQDTVDVVVTGSNQAPVADAGVDQDVYLLNDAVVSGSGSSDPDGDPLTYSWVFTSVASGSSLTNGDITDATNVVASFTPDVGGTYDLELTVDDGTTTSTDTIVINAITYSLATDIQPIFDTNCASCHSTASPSAGLDLQSNTYANIVSVPSGQLTSMNFVTPFNSAYSYLQHKIDGTQAAAGGSGLQMPRNRTPLNVFQRQIIADWIDQGANP